MPTTGAVESGDDIARRAEAWRPYRTWVSVLLRRALEDETGEISGRRGRTSGGADS